MNYRNSDAQVLKRSAAFEELWALAEI